MDLSNYEKVREKYPYYPDSMMLPTSKFAIKFTNGITSLFGCCGVSGKGYIPDFNSDHSKWIVPCLRAASEPMQAPHRTGFEGKKDGIRVLDYDEKGNPVTALDIFWVDA